MYFAVRTVPIQLGGVLFSSACVTFDGQCDLRQLAFMPSVSASVDNVPKLDRLLEAGYPFEPFRITS
jgi:hypothetical protein